jgi:hypothetical protein
MPLGWILDIRKKIFAEVKVRIVRGIRALGARSRGFVPEILEPRLADRRRAAYITGALCAKQPDARDVQLERAGKTLERPGLHAHPDAAR